MSARRQKIRVARGNSHLAIYPWIHPATGSKRWRMPIKDGGKWKYRTFKTRADAEAAAGRILDESTGAGLVWSALDGESRRFLEEVQHRTAVEDRPGVLAWLKSRSASTDISQAVAKFTAHKTAEAGEKTPHLRAVFSLLDQLAADFHGRRVAEIHLPELSDWWDARGVRLSPKTRHDHRAVLVMFWRWALRHGFAGSDPVTVAERLPNIHVPAGQKRILSPAELCAILNAVRADYRAWVVLGAFAGLRPDEIAPGQVKKSAKRGIRCEEIDWSFGVIRLPAVVSKVARPRIVPLSDALRAALPWAGIEEGMTGPVCLENPSQTKETSRLGKLVFAGAWPKDVLRHSYGSYRNAIVRSLEQVAEEMGTSVTMLHKHYHNPAAREEGEAWFAIRYDPKGSRFITCSDASSRTSEARKPA